MSNQLIKKVGVIGAGTMGTGIAQVSAMSGYKTILYDANNSVLSKALPAIEANLDKGMSLGKLTEKQKKITLQNLTTAQSINEMVVDLAIEAIVEKLGVKKEILSKVESINEENCIIASNTSSIPITQIASSLSRPGQVIGLHFFNPAHIMKLVEVIGGSDTSEETINTVIQFVKTIGKRPIMSKDSPGFIVNRVARHFYIESLNVLEEKVADVETIDTLMQSSGFKMGPFRLIDLIGVDINYKVTSTMYEAFNCDPKFRPSKIQQQKVELGLLGRKSGEGFYSYN